MAKTIDVVVVPSSHSFYRAAMSSVQSDLTFGQRARLKVNYPPGLKGLVMWTSTIRTELWMAPSLGVVGESCW